MAECPCLLDKLTRGPARTSTGKRAPKEIAGVPGDMLTKTTIEQLLYKLGQMLEEADTA